MMLTLIFSDYPVCHAYVMSKAEALINVSAKKSLALGVLSN